MLKLLKIFLFFIIFPFCISAKTIDGLIADLYKRLGNVNTIKFDFKQHITINETLEKQVIIGKVIYKKNNRIWINNFKPFKQKIISNGKKLWIYTPENKQLIIKREDNFNNDLTNLLNVIFNINVLKKKYELLFLSEHNNFYILTLKEKNTNYYNGTKLIISKKTLLPIRIKLKNKNIKVDLEIIKLKLNQKISDNFFEFVVPNGTNIWQMED